MRLTAAAAVLLLCACQDGPARWGPELSSDNSPAQDYCATPLTDKRSNEPCGSCVCYGPLNPIGSDRYDSNGNPLGQHTRATCADACKAAGSTGGKCTGDSGPNW